MVVDGDLASGPGAFGPVALFSVVTLFADQKKAQMPQAVQRAAWYGKCRPTFSDALALVRKELWAQQEATFYGSEKETRR